MTVIVNGLAINYQDEGEGAVILLLHGWGQSLGTFDSLTQLLKKNFRVVRLDLPGFGGSQQPQAAWGVGDYGAFLKSFVVKVGIKKINILAGHSFGGRIAIKVVAQKLITLDKLILINSAGKSHSQSLRNQGFKLVAKVGKAVMHVPGLARLEGPLRRRLYKSTGSTDYMTAGSMRDIFIKTINEDLTADAASISTLTLLIWGVNDSETPLQDGRELNSIIPGSKLEVLKDAGHFSYLDQTSSVAKLMGEFG